MSHVLLISSWLFAVLFGLATISFFRMGLAPQAIALLGVTLVLLPPVRAWIGDLAGQPVPWWVTLKSPRRGRRTLATSGSRCWTAGI
jgi:hypothetical protein